VTHELVSIAKVVARVPTWNPAKSARTESFDYIDLSAVDQGLKEITGSVVTSPSEAPSRARQLVAEGDILVSTVRPNLNGVAAVPRTLDGATASTGFTVLRPKRGVLDTRYLFHWVRTPAFVREMARRSTGASYPAVSDAIVKASRIPLPPLPEQQRIAAILDKADGIRRKRRQAIGLTEDLLQSAYLTLVGSKNAAYERWSPVRLERLAASRNGSIRSGPFGSALKHSEFVESGIAVLGIDNAVQNRFEWAERRFITAEKYAGLKRYRVFGGDVIVTIMGTTGRSAVVPDDIPVAITTKHLATITVNRDRALPSYLSHAIHRDPFLLGQIRARNRGAIMVGLNLGLIKELTLRLPPIEAQQKFDLAVRRIESTWERCRQAAREADDLFHSLVQRAFRGEL